MDSFFEHGNSPLDVVSYGIFYIRFSVLSMMKIVYLFYIYVLVLEELFLLYVTGDLHGEYSKLERLKFKEDDTLIVCGDFGFIWSGDKHENKVIKKISKLPFKILFVDGTHENFELLKDFPVEDFAGGTARRIGKNIYQLLRGCIYTLEGKTFFTFGGGESPDKDVRQSCAKYWEEELPNIDEMKFAVSNLNKIDRKVDYIITHEPPAKIKGLFCDKTDDINTLNRYFDDVAANVECKKWFFGSVHRDRKIAPKYIAVFNSIIELSSSETVCNR